MPPVEIHHPERRRRPRARAGRAPLALDGLDPLASTVLTVPGRVARLGDLHEPLLRLEQTLALT